MHVTVSKAEFIENATSLEDVRLCHRFPLVSKSKFVLRARQYCIDLRMAHKRKTNTEATDIISSTSLRSPEYIARVVVIYEKQVVTSLSYVVHCHKNNYTTGYLCHTGRGRLYVCGTDSEKMLR